MFSRARKEAPDRNSASLRVFLPTVASIGSRCTCRGKWAGVVQRPRLECDHASVSKGNGPDRRATLPAMLAKQGHSAFRLGIFPTSRPSKNDQLARAHNQVDRERRARLPAALRAVAGEDRERRRSEFIADDAAQAPSGVKVFSRGLSHRSCIRRSRLPVLPNDVRL